jgi:hypothetical protein
VKRRLLVAILVLLPAAGQAGGQKGPTLSDADHQYRIAIAAGWVAVAPPDRTLVAYRSPGSRAYLAVTRIDVGTRRARDADALADAIERGVERSTPGYRRIRRRAGQAGDTSLLDLWYERASSRVVLSRYLFFTRHVLVLSIGLEPGASERRAAEAMVKSFMPQR